MNKTLILILFLVGCSSSERGYKFENIDTDIEKKLVSEDKELQKFEVVEVINPELLKQDEEKLAEETSGSKGSKESQESKLAQDKDLKKQQSKTSKNGKASPSKNGAASGTAASKKSHKKEAKGQGATDKDQKLAVKDEKSHKLLEDLKNKVAQDVAEIEKKENPLPKDYPEKFLKYDEEAKKVWDIFSPKIFLNEAHIFEISYLGITAGTIRLETRPPVKLANEPAYHFKVKLKSAEYYNYIYRLNDSLESYVRIRDFMPLKFKLVQRESGQEVDDLQVFDHSTNKTTFWYRKLKKGKEKKDKKEKYMPLHFQDSFSVLQFVRGLPLKLGEKYEFPIVTRTKVWIAKMDVVNTLDKVTVANKTFSAIKVKAETRFPGVLKKRGDVIFWFSNDAQRRLLKFQAKIKIGSVKGELVKFEPGKKL